MNQNKAVEELIQGAKALLQLCRAGENLGANGNNLWARILSFKNKEILPASIGIDEEEARGYLVKAGKIWLDECRKKQGGRGSFYWNLLFLTLYLQTKDFNCEELGTTEQEVEAFKKTAPF